MDKKIIEYLIIVTAIALLAYGCYSMLGYDYKNSEEQLVVSDFITMPHPSSSGYTVNGDKIEFRNLFDIYNMDVARLDSGDVKVKNLLNHYSSFNRGTVDYKNETCYLVTIEFEDKNGFRYHSIIVPYDSFDRDTLSFTNDTKVCLFDGNSREFVVDTAFNSQVVL